MVLLHIMLSNRRATQEDLRKLLMQGSRTLCAH